MAHGGDLFALGNGVPSEQNFEIAFRGYKQDQVDNFVRLLETDLTTVSAERDEAYAQLQALTAQVHQLQLEVVEARQRITGPTTITTNVSFRHLGDRVTQILTLAEEQAEAIRAEAYDSLASERGEAERLLEDARRQHDQAIRGFEAARAAPRAEEGAAAQTEADRIIDGARAHAEQLVAGAQQQLAEFQRQQAEVSGQAEAIRAQAAQAHRDLGTAQQELARTHQQTAEAQHQLHNAQQQAAAAHQQAAAAHQLAESARAAATEQQHQQRPPEQKKPDHSKSEGTDADGQAADATEKVKVGADQEPPA